MADVPEHYQPSDMADARRIVGELWAEIEELRRLRAADDRDMVALKEKNQEVVDRHNDNVELLREMVETHNELVDKHNEIVEDVDEHVERRTEERTTAEWETIRTWSDRAERRLDDRETELAAREAILRKRYGSGRPLGRPAEYSRAQILEVRRLHEMGEPKAKIAQTVELTRRQVGYIIDRKLPGLREKSDKQRASEFTPLFSAFQKELRDWAKVLPSRRRRRHDAVIVAKVKAGVLYLNEADYDRSLRHYLANDFEPDMPARLVVAAEQLWAWMKANNSTSPAGWGR